jgi:hypothetical protein
MLQPIHLNTLLRNSIKQCYMAQLKNKLGEIPQFYLPEKRFSAKTQRVLGKNHI